LQSDAELVAESLQGNQASFGVLVGRYERAVLATALRILHDREAARDVAQDVFVTAFEKLRTLRNPAGFGGWLLRIAHNQAVSALRSRARAPEPAPLSDALPARPDTGLDPRSADLLEAVARLPENERLVIAMRYFDGLSAREIATASGRPLGTVTKQLSRAYERLRSLLSSAEDGQPAETAAGATAEQRGRGRLARENDP
jgi:RNA polymerase sigma-70 factor (ECF subfamily)